MSYLEQQDDVEEDERPVELCLACEHDLVVENLIFPDSPRVETNGVRANFLLPLPKLAKWSLATIKATALFTYSLGFH